MSTWHYGEIVFPPKLLNGEHLAKLKSFFKASLIQWRQYMQERKADWWLHVDLVFSQVVRGHVNIRLEITVKYSDNIIKSKQDIKV